MCTHSNTTIFSVPLILWPTRSHGKLITRSSPTKIRIEFLTFLEHIQGDINGNINSPCELVRYFMILINSSMRWLRVRYYRLVVKYLIDYWTNH